MEVELDIFQIPFIMLVECPDHLDIGYLTGLCIDVFLISGPKQKHNLLQFYKRNVSMVEDISLFVFLNLSLYLHNMGNMYEIHIMIAS